MDYVCFEGNSLMKKTLMKKELYSLTQPFPGRRPLRATGTDTSILTKEAPFFACGLSGFLINSPTSPTYPGVTLRFPTRAEKQKQGGSFPAG